MLQWFSMRLALYRVPGAERGTGRLNQSFLSLEMSLFHPAFHFVATQRHGLGSIGWGTDYGLFLQLHDDQAYKIYKTIGLVFQRLLQMRGVLCQDMIQDIFSHHCSF